MPLLSLLSTLPLSLVAAAHASPGSAEWVQADVLHLRAAPNAGSPSLARLAYGTWVRVEEERGTWARVTVGDRPREAELTGWVDGGFLAPTLPDRDQLLTRAQDAETPADAVRLLTRALALDPGDPDAIAMLDTVADQLGDRALQQRAGRLARGDEPVYLGSCHAGRAVVHSAVVPATGRLRPVGILDVTDEGQLGALRALGSELGGASWYGHGVEPYRVPPGRFSRPFVDASHGNTADAWAAGPFDQLVSNEGVLVLGGCDDEGGVYATVPLSAIPEAHFPPTLAAGALAGLASLDTSGSTRITLASWEGLPYLEARIDLPYVFRDCGGEESGPETVSTWWLLDESGGLVRRWGADLAPVPDGAVPFATYSRHAWFAVDLPEVSLLFSVGTGHSAMESGVSVQTFPGGAPGPVQHLALVTAGC